MKRTVTREVNEHEGVLEMRALHAHVPEKILDVAVRGNRVCHVNFIEATHLTHVLLQGLAEPLCTIDVAPGIGERLPIVVRVCRYGDQNPDSVCVHVRYLSLVPPSI